MEFHRIFTFVTGGACVALLATACATSPNNRTNAADNRFADDPTDKMTRSAEMSPQTERPIPTDRLGAGDRRTGEYKANPDDSRIVACADAKLDMTASMGCDEWNRARTHARYDRATGLAVACPSRTNATGDIVYDDPNCPERYQRQYEQAGEGCANQRDEQGNIFFNDPNCPMRTMGASYQNVRWTQESAFYDRYAFRAVRHVRQAELAAAHGHTAEMIRHAELALDQAKEAQRAANHPDLNGGIMALRDVVAWGRGDQLSHARSSVQEARVRLSKAAGIKPSTIRVPSGPRVATSKDDR